MAHNPTDLSLISILLFIVSVTVGNLHPEIMLSSTDIIISYGIKIIQAIAAMLSIAVSVGVLRAKYLKDGKLW
jgi:hypothetical protein